MKRDVRTVSPMGLGRIEHVSINQTDGYVGLDTQVDLAHGCVIVADVVADVAGDVVADAVVDAAADAAADGAADAAADGAADAAADGAADAAADGAADAAADGGLSPATLGRLKTLGLMLGGAVMGQIAAEVNAAIKKAAAGSPSAPPSSADYWNALHTSMLQDYPCDTGAGTPCGTSVRASQEAMVAQFAVNIATQNPTAGTAAVTFENAWPASSQNQLKQTLTTMSATSGIPSMVQYLATYTNPGATGGTLVIATANVLIAVAGFVYTG